MVKIPVVVLAGRVGPVGGTGSGGGLGGGGGGGDGVNDEYGEPAQPFRVRDADAAQWERTYAMWNHLGPLIGFATLMVGGGSGITFFIPALIALVMWRSRRDDSPYLDDHGREALNFHISIGLIFVASLILTIPTCGLAIVAAMFGLPVLGIVGGVMAAVAAHKGEYFRYPMTFRLLKSEDEEVPA